MITPKSFSIFRYSENLTSGKSYRSENCQTAHGHSRNYSYSTIVANDFVSNTYFSAV